MDTEQPMAEAELLTGLEALLFSATEPLEEQLLAHLLECEPQHLHGALEALTREYAGSATRRPSAFELRHVAGGWRLYTRPQWAPLIRNLCATAPANRLSQAALETLAVIAYRQPVSRATIASIRGVNVDSVTRTLLHRGLIDETGTDPQTGGTLYSTTAYFLETIGLDSLESLPPIAPLLPGADSVKDIPETEVNLPVGQDTHP